MTQEQDIVERLLEGPIAYMSDSGPIYSGPSELAREAAQTIVALRAEKAQAHKNWRNRAEAAEERVKQLETERLKLNSDIDTFAAWWEQAKSERDELSTIVSSQRTALDIAIRERDDARKENKRLREVLKDIARDHMSAAKQSDLAMQALSASSASSNREGGE